MAYEHGKRRAYLDMIDRVGHNWLHVFGDNEEFYSAAYWDLLTYLWRADKPVRKTDALGSMKGVRSPHTAGKYVEAAIEHRLVEQSDNPADARSKLLSLSPAMRQRLDDFFDKAVEEVRQTAAKL